MSIIKRISLSALGCFLSFNASANSYLPAFVSNTDNLDNNSWSVSASLGYSEYQHMVGSDGKAPIGRLGFGAELLTTNHAILGVELGLQSGNHMRLPVPEGAFGALCGAVRTSMRPMLDLLITANANILRESLLFTQLKGGVAYRHWQIENIWINNKSQLAGEVQAGLGYPLTEISNLNLLYQGIFGGNPRLRANPLSDSGFIANMPIQHGVLFGFSIIA